ncbi:MAG: hypothetical protein M3O85_04235 [Acidobacteriota bacterium]|nr:hypothetical protein [Acidobacteriota bacterium]
MAGATAPAPAAAAPAAAKSGGGALKIILLVVGGLFLLCVVVVVVAVGVGFYVAKNSHVEQGTDGAKVETPFGTVEATKDDAEKIAAKMGIQVYPGAHALPGAASVTLGSMHSATAMYESDDSAEKVAEFYRKQFPRATVTATRGEDEKESLHTVMAFGDSGKWTTITIEPSGEGCKFTLASVEK